MYKPLAVAALAVWLSGCLSTPYGEMSWTGGVAASQITSDTYRISSRGNGYTSNTTIQDYMLLKAAETTQAAGATHFVVISSADATRTSIGQTPGSATTTFSMGTARTTFDPGMTYQISKPGEDAYIRIVRLNPGQQPPPGAFAAAEIITFIGPRVQRAKT